MSISTQKFTRQIFNKKKMTASEHPASSSGGCPVDHTKSESSQKFLEASSCSYAGMSDTPLNPLNNMPNDPEQTPAQGQQASLSTEREKSTIPMGAPQSKEKVWVYPSEQVHIGPHLFLGMIICNE